MKPRAPVTEPTREPEGTPLPAAIDDVSLPERFEDLGLIDRGGMGEVRRVRDRVLDRVIALKIIGAPAEGVLAEARAAARLQHPGIVPVYETGLFADGRGWIAMRLVERRDLAEVLDATESGRAPWSRRRLVAVLASIAQTMAYAHAQGVVHRDLTPRNIRLGRFGEVMVLDWGIARHAAHEGSRAGTAGYMAPEQALGLPVDPRVDVFALGRILARILAATAGREGVDPELEALRDRAAAEDPRERPLHAGVLADEVNAWLDGARRRAEAHESVNAARASMAEASRLRDEASTLRRRAEEVLGRLEPSAPVEEKAEGWKLEDRAQALLAAANQLDLDVEHHLRAALERAGDLPEARDALADLYRRRLLEAERRSDAIVSAEYVARLSALDPTGQAEFLAGDGALTLRTDPEGATVYIAPYESRERRLVVGPERLLGTTPLHRVRVPRGSHRLRLVAPGREPVVLPIHVPRGEHVDGVPPGGSEPFPIFLPAAGDLGSDECYVPAGWFQSGGDPYAVEGLPRRRIWLDGFVIERYPLTYRRLIEALNALVDAGRADFARALAPRPAEPAGRGGDGHLSVERLPDGRYIVRAGAIGEPVDDWPVNMIDWYGAVAFAEHRARATGKPWRLPHELEREKAARGVDGRYLPWGDFFEPTWACTVHARPGAPSRAPVTAFPVDESPYGVRGLAGNVRDWCRNVFRRDGQPVGDCLEIGFLPDDDGVRVVRGGAWGAQLLLCHPAGRFGAPPDGRYFFVGVRLVRSIHGRAQS